jgi:hypothetical protein
MIFVETVALLRIGLAAAKKDYQHDQHERVLCSAAIHRDHHNEDAFHTEPRTVVSGIKTQVVNRVFNPLATARGSVSELFSLFARVIGRASEGTRLDVFESDRHANVAPPIELRRRDVAFYGQTPRVRLKILADRHDVA